MLYCCPCCVAAPLCYCPCCAAVPFCIPTPAVLLPLLCCCPYCAAAPNVLLPQLCCCARCAAAPTVLLPPLCFCRLEKLGGKGDRRGSGKREEGRGERGKGREERGKRRRREGRGGRECLSPLLQQPAHHCSTQLRNGCLSFWSVKAELGLRAPRGGKPTTLLAQLQRPSARGKRGRNTRLHPAARP